MLMVELVEIGRHDSYFGQSRPHQKFADDRFGPVLELRMPAPRKEDLLLYGATEFPWSKPFSMPMAISVMVETPSYPQFDRSSNDLTTSPSGD